MNLYALLWVASIVVSSILSSVTALIVRDKRTKEAGTIIISEYDNRAPEMYMVMNEANANIEFMQKQKRVVFYVKKRKENKSK